MERRNKEIKRLDSNPKKDLKKTRYTEKRRKSKKRDMF